MDVTAPAETDCSARSVAVVGGWSGGGSSTGSSAASGIGVPTRLVDGQHTAAAVAADHGR